MKKINPASIVVLICGCNRIFYCVFSILENQDRAKNKQTIVEYQNIDGAHIRQYLCFFMFLFSP